MAIDCGGRLSGESNVGVNRVSPQLAIDRHYTQSGSCRLTRDYASFRIIRLEAAIEYGVESG